MINDEAKGWINENISLDALDSMAENFYKECIEYPYWRTDDGNCQLWVQTIVKVKNSEDLMIAQSEGRFYQPNDQ
jgi:hypothetical protein